MKNPNPSAQMETVKVGFCRLDMWETTCRKSINTGLTSSITTQAYKQQIQIQQTCMPADKATHFRSRATIYRLIQSVKVNPSPISICSMLFFSFFFPLLPFQFCKDASKYLFRVRNNEIADLKVLKSMLVSPFRLSK